MQQTTMEERKRRKNNTQLHKEIQKNINTKIKQADEMLIIEMCD